MDKLIISGLIGERYEALDKLLEDSGIGENFTADMLRDYLSQNPEGDIDIELRTVGGDVAQGFEIYDALEREKKKGRTVKMYGKQFDSIGSIIFLAGSEGHRYSYKGAEPLIHNSWIPAEVLGDTPLNAQVLDQLSADHKASDADMLHEYLKVSGRGKRDMLIDLMRNETALTDSQLLELGFANQIISEYAKPQGTKIRALAFHRAEAPNMYADSVVIKGGKVFLIQRALDDDFEPGTWAFPGGKIESGELPEAAAVRELFEETGLRSEYTELIGEEQNEDGSKSFYYAVIAEGTPELEEDEIAAAKWFEVDVLPENIIKGQSDRYDSLIQKSIKMSEKLTRLEKATKTLEALAVKLGLAKPVAMYLPLKGGETQIFVDSEDGEFEGKTAFTVVDGERTEEPAPAGTHELEDGRSITIGPDGVVESVQMEQAMNEEEMQAMRDEVKEALSAVNEEKEAAKAKDAEISSLTAAKAKADEETKAALLAMKQEIEELKKVVPGEDSSEEERRKQVLAMKKQQEEFSKMKPSEKRLAALKLAASKN